MDRRKFLQAATSVSAGLFTPALARQALAAPTPLSFASTTGAVGLVTQVIARNSLARRHNLALDVKILTPSAAEHTTLLGQTNTGIFATLSAAAVNMEGQDIVCFGPALFMHSSLLVWKDSPYRTLEDLKGKRISLLNKVSGAYRGMQLVASWHQLDLEKDFQLVTAPPPAIITFLERKQVDAIVIHEPLVSKLLTSGDFRIVLEMNDEWKQRTKKDWLFLSLAAHDAWLKGNSDTARRLLDAVLEATHQIRSNPDLIAAEAKFLGLQTKAQIDLAVQRMPKIFPTEWNAATVEDAMEAVKHAVEMGQIKAVPKTNFVRVLS